MSCEKCKDLDGFISTGNGSVVKCTCYSEMEAGQLVGRKYQSASFKDFPERVVSQTISLMEKEENIGIIGTTGTGKTWLLTAMFKHLRESGARAFFTAYYDMAKAFAGKYEFSDDYRTLMGGIRSAEYLLIDDFGLRKESEHVAQEVFSVIEDCAKNGVPIFWTGNLKAEEMLACFGSLGARIVDRMKDNIIEMTGATKRTTTKLVF